MRPSASSPFCLASSATGVQCISFGGQLVLSKAGTWVLHRVQRGNPDIWSVAFSPDGNYIALGDGDGNVQIKTADLSQNLATYARRHPRGVSTINWVSEHRLVSGDRGGDLICWNPMDGQVFLHRDIGGCGGGVVCAAVGQHQETRYVVGTTDFGDLICISIDTLRTLWHHRRPLRGTFIASDYALDRELVAIGDNGKVMLWAPFTPKWGPRSYGVHERYEQGTGRLLARNWVNAVAFSPDQLWLASASDAQAEAAIIRI